MFYQKLPLQVEGSLPDSHVTLYLLDHHKEIAVAPRPIVVMCPGGGYGYTSPREAEIVAMQFLSMGYHAAVMSYSCIPAVFPTAVTELASVVKMVREHAEEWDINPNQVLVQGCSAGGHLAATLGTMWNQKFLGEALGVEDQSIFRPDGMILCYPVITSGEHAHRGSFTNLLGEKEAELTDFVSLENRVTEQTPPAFIWHTYTDAAVPMENSMLFASALRRAGVNFELHIFPEGSHGLSLANRLTVSSDEGLTHENVQTWVSHAHMWVERQIMKLV